MYGNCFGHYVLSTGNKLHNTGGFTIWYKYITRMLLMSRRSLAQIPFLGSRLIPSRSWGFCTPCANQLSKSLDISCSDGPPSECAGNWVYATVLLGRNLVTHKSYSHMTSVFNVFSDCSSFRNPPYDTSPISSSIGTSHAPNWSKYLDPFSSSTPLLLVTT